MLAVTIVQQKVVWDKMLMVPEIFITAILTTNQSARMQHEMKWTDQCNTGITVLKTNHFVYILG